MPRATSFVMDPPISAIVPPNLFGPALRTMRPLRLVPVAWLGSVQLRARGPTPTGQKLQVDPANFVPGGQEPPGARVAPALYQWTFSERESSTTVAGVIPVAVTLAPIRPLLTRSVLFEVPVALTVL